jgi:hypothetical protein
MSRNLKKLSHKYEFLKFELEEVEEALEGYMVEWNRYFGKYFQKEVQEVWVNEESGEMKFEEPEIEDEPKLNRKTRRAKPKKLKKLYKEISKYTHPDRGGDPETFKKVADYYEQEDLIELLKFAGLYKIDFEVEEEDEAIIEKSCSEFQNKIETHKNSMAWAYFTGDKRKKLEVIKMLEAFLKQEIKKEDYPPDLLDD